MLHKSVVICAMLLSSLPLAQAQEGEAEYVAQCFQESYPQTVVADGRQLLVRGKAIAIARHAVQEHAVLLEEGGLIDQIAQIYPRKFAVPARNHDPGRIRHQAFFTAMYGASKSEIEKDLVEVYWEPSGQYLRFNQRNGAADVLRAVGRILAADPKTKAMAGNSLGTFNYRKISGTNRLSAHAFAIAIDFSLPKPLARYWQWSGCRKGKACPYPHELLENETLRDMVRVFEQHGFVWGGKWYHHDSVHFEYRPELLNPNCRKKI